MQATLEHTTLGDITAVTQIFYDPNPKETIVEADEVRVGVGSGSVWLGVGWQRSVTISGSTAPVEWPSTPSLG